MYSWRVPDFINQLGFDSVTALQAYVTTTRAQLRQRREALTEDEHLLFIGLEAYMFRHQRDIQHRISFAFESHQAPVQLARQRMTAWQHVQHASQHSTCVCNGTWIDSCRELLRAQVQGFPSDGIRQERPYATAVKAALRRALQLRNRKHSSVYFYGPKDAGKSFLLKPLIELFADLAFTRPVGKPSNYPLQDLFGKKMVILQDLRMSTFQLAFDHLLAWFEGEKFRVPLPQNHHKGDGLYTEAAPIVASSSSKLRIDRAFLDAGLDPDRQDAMMDTRWVYFHMPVSMPADIEAPTPCARCFATWLCSDDPADQTPPLDSQWESPILSQVHVGDEAEAILALTDWIETHAPANVCDVGRMSDSVLWSQRYLQRCGRLLPFLRERFSVDAQGNISL